MIQVNEPQKQQAVLSEWAAFGIAMHIKRAFQSNPELAAEFEKWKETPEGKRYK